VNRRTQVSGANEDSQKFDSLIAKFSLILQYRLKKSISIVIQIFLVMLSTEAESDQLLSALHDAQGQIESICRQEMNNARRNDN
jgi:hypothetical protein